MSVELLYFSAPWCAPCKQTSPVIDELAAAHPSLTVTKINIDTDPTTASQYHVRSVPTIIILRDGVVVATKAGSVPRGKLIEWVESIIAD